MFAGESGNEAVSLAMDRYAGGDDAAFDVVYDELAPRLVAFFVRRTRNRDDAEELVSETFVKMHLARRHFIPGGDVLPWVYAIARNVWIDDHRKRRSKPALASQAQQTTEREDRLPSSQKLLERRELGVILARALLRLNAPLRQAFELVQLEELSIRDAAATAGCTETAMKLRAHRSYEALRAEISQQV